MLVPFLPMESSRGFACELVNTFAMHFSLFWTSLSQKMGAPMVLLFSNFPTSFLSNGTRTLSKKLLPVYIYFPPFLSNVSQKMAASVVLVFHFSNLPIVFNKWDQNSSEKLLLLYTYFFLIPFLSTGPEMLFQFSSLKNIFLKYPIGCLWSE